MWGFCLVLKYERTRTRLVFEDETMTVRQASPKTKIPIKTMGILSRLEVREDSNPSRL